MFEHTANHDHESLHFFEDKECGLKAIIALHSTARGPGAGGCRMWNYPDQAALVTDALRLSEGMSYKNAVADIPFGGGKGVIWGNPKTDKSPELFRAFGRAVDTLGGKYWTAEDVGITPSDMAIAREETKYVAGLDTGNAASGDPSPVTARGVYEGIRVAMRHALGTDDLNGRKIAVQGVGHVGAYVCQHLAEAGADLIITDVNQDALERVKTQTGAKIVEPNDIYHQDVDVFSPNALGAIVNEKTLDVFKCKVIAGGANNQLETLNLGKKLKDRGILYAPDYVINGGGIINVAAEISGHYDPKWVDGKLDRLMMTLNDILSDALRSDTPPHEVAGDLARKRIAAAKA